MFKDNNQQKRNNATHTKRPIMPVWIFISGRQLQAATQTTATPTTSSNGQTAAVY